MCITSLSQTKAESQSERESDGMCCNVCCVQKVSSEVRPVWFVFAGMGTQWTHMGRDLMTLDCFRESIMRSDTVLRPYGIQLCDLLMDSKEDTFNDTVNSFVGIASIQVLYLLQSSLW